MPNYNKVMLMGHLVRDPELKYIPSGAAVCEFSVAVNNKFKSGDEWKDKTAFLDVIAWSKTAENIVKFFFKGSPIFIEGRLEQDRWEADGKKRSKIKVVLEKFEFVGGGKGDSNQSSGGGQQQQSSDDVVPF